MNVTDLPQLYQTFELFHLTVVFLMKKQNFSSEKTKHTKVENSGLSGHFPDLKNVFIIKDDI